MRPVGLLGSVIAGLALACAQRGFTAEVTPFDLSQVAREFDQRSWRYEHGLPAGDRVHAILQTRDGYLWLGTQYGLARFDGRTFAVFDHVNTPALSSDDCRTLAEDTEGNLWVGTKENLVRKSGNQFTRINATPGWERLRAYPPLSASRGGGVWAGGAGCVWRILDGRVKMHAPNHTSIDLSEVTTLEEDERGFLWIGTPTGLRLFNERQGLFEAIEIEDGQPRPVFDIWHIPDGKLWILSADVAPQVGGPVPNTRIYCLEPGNQLKRPVVIEKWEGVGWQGHSMIGGRQGTLWVAGGGGGISRYRNGRLELLPIFSDHALSAFPDREGNLWVGTDKSGLHRWTPRKVTLCTTREGLPHDNAWSIFQGADGSVWVGTDGGVARFKDGQSNVLKRSDGSQPQDVRAVVQDRDGTIWVGTMRSLECFSGSLNRNIDLPGEWFEAKIRALCPARDGSLWVGTVRGLTRLHKEERTKYTRVDGLGSDEIRAILESGSGDLWVGTLGGGLSRWHDGQFTTLSATNGLSSNNAWALHEDTEGVLWVGTDNGLNRIEAGQITRFGMAQGLPDPLVNSVLSDDLGGLWVGHDRGIYVVDKQQLLEVARGKRAQVEAVNFGEPDGLLSIETNGQKSYPAACKTRDGRLWFPTTRGVAIIEPAKLRRHSIAPLAVIEKVRVNGNEVLGNHPESPSPNEGTSQARVNAGSLRLPPGSGRVLEFHYAANTFVAPDKTRFKYRLVGLDDNWIDAGTRREAYFANLHPGEYRFEVAACNHHGVWQDRSVAVAFQLMPFYYETWWFYGACGAVAAALIAMTVRWRARERQRINKLERANALSEQRRRIARDIHDELGASLTHILKLSDPALTARTNPDNPTSAAGHIAAIAGEAVDNLGEIVWANNPEYDTLEDLTAYLREYAASYFADTGIRVRYDFPEAVPARTVSGLFRRHLVLVLKEALHNVSKHAGARQVQVRLTLHDGWLDLAVADDGRGLPAGRALHHGNGLNNMQARVQELGGEFRMDSEPGKGTKIQVVVPLNSP